MKRWHKQDKLETTACEYCGQMCELAFTTGDCCDCFNEYSTGDMANCNICIKRQEEKQAHFEWLDKNTIRLSNFIRMDQK